MDDYVDDSALLPEFDLASRILGIQQIDIAKAGFNDSHRLYFENEAKRLIFQKARQKPDFSNPIKAAEQDAYFEAAIDVYLTLAGISQER
jgi:hypothetical protein